MTQFHPKRGGSSLTLTYQGQTYDQKCNPKQLPNKTLVFVAMVAPTVHTTQQNFVIGQFLNKEQI